MYENKPLDKRYTGLTEKELAAESKTISKELKSLEASLRRYEKLQDDEYGLDTVRSLRRVQAGKETSQDLKDLLLSGAFNKEIHTALKNWLAREGRSDALSIVALEDTFYGSSEYILVPFEIDISGGVTDELVEAVTRVTEKLNIRDGKAGRHDTTFRLVISELYITLVTHTDGEGKSVTTGTCGRHSSAWYGERSDYTVREVLEEASARYSDAQLRRLTGDLSYYTRGNDAEKIAEAQAKLDALLARRKVEAKESKKAGFFGRLFGK